MKNASQHFRRRSVRFKIGVVAVCVLAVAMLAPRAYHWSLQAPRDGREQAASFMDDALEKARADDPSFQTPKNLTVQNPHWLVDFTGWPLAIPSDPSWTPCRTALVFDGDSPYLVIGEIHCDGGVSYAGSGGWARALDGLVGADDEVVFVETADNAFAANLTTNKVYTLEDATSPNANARQTDFATSAWLLLAARLFGY